MVRNSSPANAHAKSLMPVIKVRTQRLERESGLTVEPDGHAANELADTPPTLFLDFDGTLHIGRASMDERKVISLNTGRPVFEFAPMLIALLEPYPDVRLVLTTSWLMTLTEEEVVALMPSELGSRVSGTTRYVASRFSCILNGTDRTYVIWKYASGTRLKHWLAVDDAVYGADEFGRTRGELVEHFLLLHPQRGLGDEGARQRVEQWLVDTHSRLAAGKKRTL